MRNRFEFSKRDVLKSIQIERRHFYDLESNKTRTQFLVESSSYPNYKPYYTPKDDRGRSRAYQRRNKHKYKVIISLDILSIDSPNLKLRTGSQAVWDKRVAQIKKDKKGRVIRDNLDIVQKGINPDFRFRLESVYNQNGILFGRDMTKGVPPVKTNPKQIVFLDKHMLSVIRILMNRKILK